jgi:phenylacetate-coenzyme A ligase PaaK-like adenylate-forming protein
MNLLTVLRLLSTLRPLRAHERWTRPQLEAYQQQQINLLRAFAYKHSPFYRQFHQGLFDRPLSELPVLTKQVMMASFDELVTHLTQQAESAGAVVRNQKRNAEPRYTVWF